MTEPAYDEFQDEAPPKLRRIGPTFLIVALVILAMLFAAVAWFALSSENGLNGQQIAAFEPPLLKADPTPYKRKPEDPGGMQIPNQDKLVYERILPKPGPQTTEHLLPKPEEPMARPKPEDPPAPAPAVEPAQSSDAQPEEEPLSPPAATESQDAVSTADAEDKAEKETAESSEQADTADLSEETPAGVRMSEDGIPMPTEKPAQLAALPASAATAVETSATVDGGGLTDSYRLQLAAFRDEAQAMTAWQRLRKKYASELDELKPMLVRVEIAGKGVFHRLQVGPYADATAAETSCAALKAKKQDCLIVRPN